MILRIAIVACITACGLFLSANAQDTSTVQFGHITSRDFDLSGYHFDTSASAVIIADVGSSSIEANPLGWFSLVFKRHRRVKILNKNGFNAAKETILLYSNEKAEETLADLKATTYNILDGKIEETVLDNNSVYSEKVSKTRQNKKFAMPAVKEGSIIDYSYTIHSDFLYNLQPWYFQDIYPCLVSEYEVRIPEFFQYIFLSHGYRSFSSTTQSNEYRSYDITFPHIYVTGQNQYFTIRGNVVHKRWTMKNLPELKAEIYTTTLRNHLAMIEFQLFKYKFPNYTTDIMGTWATKSDELLKSEYFGAGLEKINNWLNDDLKEITGTASNDLDKAKKIYTYIRDNFTCTDHDTWYTENPLKTTFKNKKGSVAEINLLLVAMLRQEEMKADPVLLSTRSNGFAPDSFPLVDRFNYVIVQMIIQDKRYYLDASRPELGFARLPNDCYNGTAHVISTDSRPVYFSTDSLEEKKTTSVFLLNNGKGQLEGNFQSTFGYNESANVRRSIRDNGSDAFFKTVRSGFGSGFRIQEISLDSIKQPERPVQLHYNFVMDTNNEPIIYFNPILSEGYQNNIFKAAERYYPVEMPYTRNETFIFNMEIPEGYTVDELPKSAKVSFNENVGTFEYIVVKTETNIQLKSKIVLKKANFTPDEYNSLRDFFGYIVKKHSEQIVFKKKK